MPDQQLHLISAAANNHLQTAIDGGTMRHSASLRLAIFKLRIYARTRLNIVVEDERQKICRDPGHWASQAYCADKRVERTRREGLGAPQLFEFSWH